MMKLSILGTSNSIFNDGYFAGMAKSEKVGHSKRYSMGLSSALIGPFFRRSINFNDFTHVIIDVAVNECMFARKSQTTRERIFDALDYICAEAISCSCQPVFFIMPSYLVYENPGPSAVAIGAILDVAKKYSAPVLNVYDILRILRPLGGNRNHRDVFIDASHLNRDFARRIGALLVEAIARIPDTEQPIQPMSISWPSYRLISAADLVGVDSLVKRKTSLIDAVTTVISQKSGVITLNLARGEAIVGVCANVAGSGCVVEMIGSCVWRKSFVTQYSSRKDVTFLALLPMLSALYPDTDGQISLRILPADDERLDEPPLAVNVEVESVGLELCSLIVQGEARESEVTLLREGGMLDLLQFIGKAELNDLLIQDC